MRVLSNKSFSHYRCVEAALPFSAVAQRLLIGGKCMGYLIYLAGLLICLIYGISFNRIYNFIDLISFVFVVVPCILILISTGYWKGFIKAFAYISGRKIYSKKDMKESARAVKLVCISSLIFGMLGIIISLINVLHCMDLDSGLSNIGPDISVALVSVFYAVFINAVLVPLYFKLKGCEEK